MINPSSLFCRIRWTIFLLLCTSSCKYGSPLFVLFISSLLTTVPVPEQTLTRTWQSRDCHFPEDVFEKPLLPISRANIATFMKSSSRGSLTTAPIATASSSVAVDTLFLSKTSVVFHSDVFLTYAAHPRQVSAM